MRYSHVLTVRASDEDLAELAAVRQRLPVMKRATLIREAMRLGLRTLRRKGAAALERLDWVACSPDGPAHLLNPARKGTGVALCGGAVAAVADFEPADDRERCAECEEMHDAAEPGR